ncbi:MAG TPA: AI-2E family transporter [Acidimicrobiia bacterium]|nr:AI-2E family transporter [Acidimicrobiia bacterium]HKZ20173.1 AI-2E family transporter [Acidimicrobiia bacterium]
MIEETTRERIQRFALLVWSVIGVLALVWLLIRIAESIRIIWLPLAFAAGLVFLLNPLVNYFEARRIPRVAGTFLAFAFLVAVIVAGFSLLVPAIRTQAEAFASSLPETYDVVLTWIDDVAERFNIEVDLSQGAIAEWLADPANQETIQQVVGNFGSLGGRLVRGVAEGLAVLVLAPLLALYMLIDLRRGKALAVELTPPRHREEAVYVAGEVATALGSFVRGQLLVAFIVGVASSIGLWLLGIPFWLIIGILAGILNLIPFAGPVVGGALAAIVALLDASVGKALLAILVFTLIQQIDNHVITPLVQRARVQLSPMVIVLALIVGGSLAGLLGVLVAVPLTAAVRIVVGHLWRTRMLGQSWDEASQRMIELRPPPDRIVGIRRRNVAGQQRLFDTAERPAVPVEK